MATALATHATPTQQAVFYREQVAQVCPRRLPSNREIGVARGVLMHAHDITPEQAFPLLRSVSQSTNRRLRDGAAEVAATGGLTLPPRRSASHPRTAGPDTTDRLTHRRQGMCRRGTVPESALLRRLRCLRRGRDVLPAPHGCQPA